MHYAMAIHVLVVNTMKVALNDNRDVAEVTEGGKEFHRLEVCGKSEERK